MVRLDERMSASSVKYSSRGGPGANRMSIRAGAPPDTARTRIERDFDPVQVRKLKEAADRDLTVGGARLAAQAIAAGLVDEYQLFVVPAVVGGGTRALPDQVCLNLALAEERRFGSGTVYLCYNQA